MHRSRFVLCLILLAAAAIASCADSDPIAPVLERADPAELVPVHSVIFAMNPDGKMMPQSYDAIPWPKNRISTARPPVILKEGEISVEGLDDHENVIYQTVERVDLWVYFEPSAADRPGMARNESPLLAVLIPQRARYLRVRGWLPATRATYDLRNIAKDPSILFPAGLKSQRATPPK